MEASTMNRTQGLRKTFKPRRGTVEAVGGVDLTVQGGVIFGLLGPNGAGKTTLMRMLTTLLPPTDGEATVAGHDLRREPARVRERIGYVSQAGGVDITATGRENLILQGRLYGLDTARVRERAATLIAALELDAFADRMAGTYSGGQRRRLDLALGLVHQPPLLFLDEPTTGLDPQGRSNLWGHIRRLRDEQQTTVFLTTHYLDEADALCDHILIIDHGRIVTEGSPNELKQRISGDVITIEVAEGVDRARAVLAEHVGAREITISGATLRLTIERGDQVL